MRGKFIMSGDADMRVMEWGRLGWLSNPAVTGARQMTVIAGIFSPGYGHTFHYHPDQEEIIYVLAGSLEHWNEQEKRILGAGDCVFIPVGLVHASFNAGTDDAKVLAILGPCVGDMGVEQVDVSGEAPWNTLRGGEPD
jgi:quercetin dioxygenase-like cupin family protein